MAGVRWVNAVMSAGVSAVVVVCAFPLTYGLVGDLSTDAAPSDELDYFWHAPEIAPGVAALVVVLASVLFVAGWVHLLLAPPRRRLPREWRSIVIWLSVGSAGLAVCARMMTAGVIGANIGAGIIVLFGPPVAAVGLALLAWRAVKLTRGSGVP